MFFFKPQTKKDALLQCPGLSTKTRDTAKKQGSPHKLALTTPPLRFPRQQTSYTHDRVEGGLHQGIRHPAPYQRRRRRRRDRCRLDSASRDRPPGERDVVDRTALPALPGGVRGVAREEGDLGLGAPPRDRRAPGGLRAVHVGAAPVRRPSLTSGRVGR